jgi:hypothetical protein
MGTQQLLLIVVGVILVGIMIAVGLFMFRDQAAATNRDALVNDVTHLAAAAQQYYRRPRIFGGGGSMFDGLTLERITTKPSNANGTYELAPALVTGNPASIQIIGTGRETGLDGTDKVRVVVVVFPDSIFVDNSIGN